MQIMIMVVKDNEAIDASGKTFTSWKSAIDHLLHGENRHKILYDSDHLKEVLLTSWDNKTTLTYYLIDVTPIITEQVMKIAKNP